MDEVSKYRGLIATAFFHATIIALLLMLRLYGSPKLPDAEGITINFGTDVAGMGEMEPQQQELNQPETPARVVAPPIKTKPVKEKVKETAPDLLTQDNEAAPTVNKQDNEKDLAEKKKLDENKRLEQEERELQRQAEIERQKVEAEQKRLAELENQRIEAERKKAEQQQAQIDAKKKLAGKSFGGNSTNTGTQGEGNTQTTGNQGDPTGSVDSKNHNPGGSQGAGISLNLDGRSVFGNYAKPDYSVNDYGIVVVTIRVNKNGDVIMATPGAIGTKTTNSTLWEAARKAAQATRFNKVATSDATAPAYQEGTITYNFKYQ